MNLLKGEEKLIEEMEGDGWAHGQLHPVHETEGTIHSTMEASPPPKGDDSGDDKIVEV